MLLLPVSTSELLMGSFLFHRCEKETLSSTPQLAEKPKGVTHMGMAGTDSGCQRSGANSEIPDSRNIVGLVLSCCIIPD